MSDCPDLNNFEDTTFPQCNKFVKKNNFCCGDTETINNFYNPDCNQFNNISNKKKLSSLILTILRHSRLIYKIAQTKKMSREYYNQHKSFCTTLNTRLIEGGTKTLNLYLNQDCNLDFQAGSENTYVMRLVAGLPSMWSCYATKGGVSYPRLKPGPKNNLWANYGLGGATPYSKVLPFCSNEKIPLSENEKRIKYYMDNSDFLVSTLSALKNSIYTYAKHKDLCKVFKVPKYMSPNGVSYKASLTGKEMKMLYCLYLRRQGCGASKLPYSG
jgi:hypothetical protein